MSRTITKQGLVVKLKCRIHFSDKLACIPSHLGDFAAQVLSESCSEEKILIDGNSTSLLLPWEYQNGLKTTTDMLCIYSKLLFGFLKIYSKLLINCPFSVETRGKSFFYVA